MSRITGSSAALTVRPDATVHGCERVCAAYRGSTLPRQSLGFGSLTGPPDGMAFRSPRSSDAARRELGSTKVTIWLGRKLVPRYVAFLRGVSPMNAKMPALKSCFEAEGFSGVRTLLSSGNVVFNARSLSLATLERRAQNTMQAELGRSFDTFVRSTEYLRELIESDPFAEFGLPPEAKRVITFLRRPADPKVTLPFERDGVSILKFTGSEVLAAYLPGPKGRQRGLLSR